MNARQDKAIAARHPGSFRDTSGYVYVSGDRVYRTVTDAGREEYEFVRGSGLPETLVADGRLLPASEVDRSVLGDVPEQVAYVLEHPRLPFVSHPYEWPFEALREAALLTLRVHLAALERGVTLSDASAYNVQFFGSDPVFVDYLSFRRYRDGEFWFGHRQFCQQFLNPLLLTAFTGVPYNAYYRGALDGIPAACLRRLLPWHHKVRWQVLTNVVLQAKLESGAPIIRESQASVAGRRLPRSGFLGMLRGLEEWIGRLDCRKPGASKWGKYAADNTYTEAERDAKRRFVERFAAKTRPSMLWDLGCNTGEYAEAALAAGASTAVGFDSDHGALDAAFARARAGGLRLLVLFADAVNPSPNQGWAERERSGLAARGPADAVLALALLHHLAIGHNVPLQEAVQWVIGMAPSGVLEFVPKNDPTVKMMLSGRTDIFDDYSEEAFLSGVRKHAAIVESEQITSSGRRLVWYSK